MDNKKIIGVLGTAFFIVVAIRYSLIVLIPWFFFITWYMNRSVFNEHFVPNKKNLKPFLSGLFNKQKKDEEQKDKGE